jgi:hypothetical protein
VNDDGARLDRRLPRALLGATLLVGCATWRAPAHPAHIDPAQRGTAFVGQAPPFVPVLAARLLALRVSDDDGRYEARVVPEQIAAWVAFANQVFRPAGIRLDFDPGDLLPLRSSLINRLQGPEQEDWRAAKHAADEVAARYPDRLVVFFRQGGRAQATGAGLSWTDYNFVVMPGWPDDRHCGHDHPSALAHEIGHHLGLAHTFARVFPEPVDAGVYLARRNRDLRVFDGDGLGETAPDPAIRTTECADVRVVELDGLRVPLARRNIMSYYDERDSLSRQQMRLLRWFLRQRLAHRMKLPRNQPPGGALEVEQLVPIDDASERCGRQKMDAFGVGNWSAGGQLFCGSPHGPQEVTLELPVSVTGLSRIEVYLTRGPDFGVVEVLLDGQPLGAPYDAWAPAVLASGPITLGERRLRAGPHRITFRVRDRNLASAAFNLGIDAIALVSVEPQV